MRSSRGKTYDGPHADRVRRRRPGACLPGGREDRHRPRAGARPAPASAAPSASCARRSATRWCAACISGSPRFDVGAVNALLRRHGARRPTAVVAQGSFGAPTTRDAASPTCAMSARATKSRCRCRRAPLAPADVAAIRAAYDAEYARFYDRPVPGSDVEIMSYAVVVATMPETRRRAPRRRRRRAAAPGRARRRCATPRPARSPTGRSTTAPRSRPGATLRGPAIIAEDETSTLVGPGWTARIDARRLHRTDARRRRHERQTTRWPRIQPAGHVEPPDRGGRGTGADHDPHRLLAPRCARPATSPPASSTCTAACWRRRSPARPATSTRWRKASAISCAKFPAETMQPGDHYITNDPWLGTGHLHDLTVVTPAFHRGRIVGLFANTAHVIDIGGLGMGPEGRIGVRGRAVHPDRQMLRPGPAERDVLRLHPRRLAPAGRAGGRHLFAVRLQRCRRAAAGAR